MVDAPGFRQLLRFLDAISCILINFRVRTGESPSDLLPQICTVKFTSTDIGPSFHYYYYCYVILTIFIIIITINIIMASIIIITRPH